MIDPRLSRSGDYWTAEFLGRALHLHHTKGLRDLARLLSRPNEDCHVLELIEEQAAREASPPRAAAAQQDGLAIRSPSAWHEPIDARARAAYRARYAELRSALEEAEERSDLGQVERFRCELSSLTDELRQRTRVPSSEIERARKAVYNRVRAAIQHIGQHDRALCGYLQLTVKTGTVCCYRPIPC